MRPLGAGLFHADGRTADMMKLRVAFRNFAKGPKIKWTLYREIISVMRSVENTHALHVQHVERLNVKAGSHDKKDYIPYTKLIGFYIRHCLCAV